MIEMSRKSENRQRRGKCKGSDPIIDASDNLSSGTLINFGSAAPTWSQAPHQALLSAEPAVTSRDNSSPS